MRNLLIILLVSILGCGWVASQKNVEKVLYLSNMMNDVNQTMNEFLFNFHTTIQGVVFKYSQNKEYYQQLAIAEKFLNKNRNIVDSVIINKYLNFRDNDIIYRVENEQNFTPYLSIDIDHKNQYFQSLLNKIKYQQIEIKRFELANYTASNFYISGYYWAKIAVCTNTKTLQKDKISMLPITLNEFHKKQLTIRKIWINGELAFERTLANPFMPKKINLTYNGDKQTHVKVAIQNSYNGKPIYQERTFDFQIHTCN